MLSVTSLAEYEDVTVIHQCVDSFSLFALETLCGGYDSNESCFGIFGLYIVMQPTQ